MKHANGDAIVVRTAMETIVKRTLSMGALVAVVVLAGCADTRGPTTGSSSSIGYPGVGYKIGKPYQINGIWYRPEEDFDYEEVGDASWYGRQFHGKYTANGEIYDMNAMTAAHRTLPMPSVVRVTNLDNGRTVQLRVNDRGPFAKERIIDVSRRAAQMLGFQNKGVTRVKVEILAEESMMLARQGGSGGSMSEPIAEVGLAPDPAVAALNREQLASVKTTTPRARDVSATPIPAPVTTRTAAATPTYKPMGKATDSRTYIQAGAFSDPNNAHRVRSRLSGLGPVEVRSLQVNGRDFYRVRLGPLPSDGEADRLLADVIRAGYPSSHIVSE